MIPSEYYGKILFPDRFIHFKTYTLLHNHHSIDKFCVGMFGTVKQEFVDIFNFYRIKLFEEVRTHIQTRNLNGFDSKTGASGSGTDLRLHFDDLQLFHGTKN